MRVDDDNNIVAQVTCRVRIDRAGADSPPAGIRPSDVDLVISPTPLLAAGWPDGDPSHIVPLENAGDKIVLDGGDARRAVIKADPKRIDGQVVRINLRISG
jgi:hypothetical protein